MEERRGPASRALECGQSSRSTLKMGLSAGHRARVYVSHSIKITGNLPRSGVYRNTGIAFVVGNTARGLDGSRSKQKNRRTTGLTIFIESYSPLTNDVKYVMVETELGR